MPFSRPPGARSTNRLGGRLLAVAVAVSAAAVTVTVAIPATAATAADTAPTAADTPVNLVLDGESLTYRDIVAVLDSPRLNVTLKPSARAHMAEVRAQAQKALADDPAKGVYGWNRGLGPLKDKTLTVEQQQAFQHNILLSHSAGVGPAFPAAVARLWMVLKANQLAKGTSGVRPELAERILQLVDAGVTPEMPQVGSLGIGDLQPQAEGGLVITGFEADAPARLGDRVGTAKDILSAAKLAPDFPLEQGEALPVISGSTMVAASFGYGVQHAEQAADLAEGGVALFMEATRAMANALDARPHADRNIPAEDDVAARMRALVAGSEWMTAQGRAALGEKKDRVQDAVSVRAAPHIIAALRGSLAEDETTLAREANASTTNPLLFPRADGAPGYEFVTSGNWDGDVIGHASDTLNAEITDIAVLQQELSARLLAPEWSYGLPANLAGGTPGLNSGMVQVQTVAAALIPEMQTRAVPSGTLSRPAKFGQEDHNTMAMAGLRNLHENLDRMRYVQAVETLMSAQGVSLIQPQMVAAADGRPLSLGTGTSAMFHAVVCQEPATPDCVRPQGDDRYMTPDLDTTVRLIDSGVLGDVVRGAEPVGLRVVA